MINVFIFFSVRVYYPSRRNIDLWEGVKLLFFSREREREKEFRSVFLHMFLSQDLCRTINSKISISLSKTTNRKCLLCLLQSRSLVYFGFGIITQIIRRESNVSWYLIDPQCKTPLFVTWKKNENITSFVLFIPIHMHCSFYFSGFFNTQYLLPV